MASSGVDIAALKTALYDACQPLAAEKPHMTFNQAFISDLNIIPNNDVNILLAVTQALVDDKLFKILQGEGLQWRLRPVEEARKYRGLKPEHEIVYQLIDDAGVEGLWTKTIKARSNLHDAVFRAAIKHLEGKHMITEMKSVEHPTRKMYIKATLQPSQRATGGSWYDGAELDEEFVSIVYNILYDYIKKHSFYHGRSSSSKAKKIKKKLTPEEVKAAKAERAKGLGAPKEEVKDERTAGQKKYENLLPMPAGYTGYPDVHELTAFVENSNLLTATLSAVEIQQILDLLCYDLMIEKVTGLAEPVYKATRTALLDGADGPSSVLTEAPCGRCPVFNLCEEGGPVGPSNCEYFTAWLDL